LRVAPWEMAGGGGGPMLPILSGSLERRARIVEAGGRGGGRQEQKDVSKLIGVASEVLVYFFVW
jgi:hypothetical protein